MALATSPSGRTSGLQSTIERLREVCSLQLLLAPEHGVRGDKGAGENFENAVDGPSGLPVASLYGKEASHHLSEEACAAFDILVYDIQDVGARCYTFISTLQILLEDCARYGKRLIVLDRPNPLGDMAEGMLLRLDTRSFVGCYDIPLRYGLTCGEFALMVNHERDLGCDLQVIPCLGWNRHALFPELNREVLEDSIQSYALRQKYRIAYFITNYHAAALDAEHAELLHCKKGLPVMDITSRGVLRDGRIFVYSRIKAVQYECTYVSPFNKDVFLSRRKIITEDA